MAKKSKLTSDDLARLSILAFNTEFWIPVFYTDRLVENDYVLKGRVNVPVDESFAHADLYLACLRSEKERYQPLFNAVRVKALRQKD